MIFGRIAMPRAIRCGRSGSVECGRSSGWVSPSPPVQRAGSSQLTRSSACVHLGERGDIIKRLHKTLTKDGATRAPSSWALEGESHGEPIIGRLIGPRP